MHRSELDLTAHVPLDGADERDAERYTTTRLVRFVRKNQIYATYVWTTPTKLLFLFTFTYTARGK